MTWVPPLRLETPLFAPAMESFARLLPCFNFWMTVCACAVVILLLYLNDRAKSCANKTLISWVRGQFKRTPCDFWSEREGMEVKSLAPDEFLSVLDLPDEVLVLILQHLPLLELANARLVSSKNYPVVCFCDYVCTVPCNT